MSFLTPLYIAGALAVSLPILFHLIRRTPRGETPFSSLMFLSPSPPRITRRSRIEHWLLLALRGLALVLLALAFARPFWRQPVQASDNAVAERRIAVIVDTSASMRRGDLWQQAVRAADQTLAECRPQDHVAVFACDESLRPIAGFDDLAQVEPTRRRAVVATRLAALRPTWAGTHLGQALLDAVALVSDSRDDTEKTGRAARTIVLVSDLQAGSRPGVLGDYPWPADVQLELKRVAIANPTNAGLWRLADDASADQRGDASGKTKLRIRVANASDSDAEQFQLQWTSAEGASVGPSVDAYVPAGESRVVRVDPPATDGAGPPRLVLRGDAHEFDDTLYIVPDDRRHVTVDYLGDDKANDPQGLRYYLDRAVTADPARDVSVQSYAISANGVATDDQAPPLIVATDDPTTEHADALRQYIADGGTLLDVLTTASAQPGLAAILKIDELPIEEAAVDDYAMFAEIDFDHPLFAAMAGPKFNDFSQIRFWKHRTLDVAAIPDARVVARFDDGDAAIVEQRIGAGRLVVMTAGWQPSDGQLARSWKFLLMLSSLVDNNRAAGFRTDYLVHERVALPDRALLAANVTVTKPDGATASLAKDAVAFTDMDAPGLYSFAGVKGPIRFAVNVDPTESDTAPLPPEAFEQLGARLAGKTAPPADAEHLQQLRDVELESRQRVWQWLVAAALGVLILETWLAGRLSRRMEPPTPSLSPA
jgi:hypothetical protein